MTKKATDTENPESFETTASEDLLSSEDMNLFNDNENFQDFGGGTFKPSFNSAEAETEFSAAFLEAALALSGKNGWENISLSQVAQEADIPLSWVREHIPCKAVLVHKINAYMDHFTFHENEFFDPAALRENLFDLLMRRLEGFQTYRSGMLSMLRALPFHPAQAMAFAAGNLETITWVADVAGLNRKNMKGFFRLQALGALWAHLLRVWMKDSGEGLEETMIALNEGLDRMKKYHQLSPLQIF